MAVLFGEGYNAQQIRDHAVKNAWMPVPTLKSIDKHFTQCVGRAIERAGYPERSAQAFLGRIDALRERIERYLNEFDESGHVCAKCREPDEDAPKGGKDYRAASALLKEVRETLVLEGKTLGHIRPDVEIAIVNHPQFVAVVDPIVNITASCATCGPRVEAVLEAEG